MRGRDYTMENSYFMCLGERESLLCWYECDVSVVSNRERI